MPIQSYRDLRVWQEGVSLAELVYRTTRSFPKEEMFGLTSQMRRASVSVPANIAEGYGRENAGSYLQFLRIAQGSLKEVETHAIIAHRVGLLAEEGLNVILAVSTSTGKMLRSLIRAIEKA